MANSEVHNGKWVNNKMGWGAGLEAEVTLNSTDPATLVAADPAKAHHLLGITIANESYVECTVTLTNGGRSRVLPVPAFGGVCLGYGIIVWMGGDENSAITVQCSAAAAEVQVIIAYL